MEKQKMERIMQMINANSDLKEQYEENPDYAVDITEAELARNLGEAMRNQGYINYSYELLHYGYNVTADVYVAKGEERVNKEMVRK